MPSDPTERAHVLSLVYTIACDTHPLQNLRILQTFPEDQRATFAQQIIGNGLAVFESLLKDASSKYCYGDQITLADVVLVPQVYNAHRWGVDMSKFPRIVSIVGKLSELTALQSAHPDNQPDAPKAK